MRCRDVRGALLERDIGRLPQDAARALDAHLGGCPRCAAVARAERRLTDDLLSLRAPAPVEVDVTRRVMLALASEPAGPADAVTPRQLGWAAAAALAGCSLLGIGFWSVLPRIFSAAREAWALNSGIRGLLASAGSAATAVLSATARAVARTIESLAPLAASLENFEPLAAGAIGSCAAVMAATIVFIVGRDLRGTPRLGEER